MLKEQFLIGIKNHSKQIMPNGTRVVLFGSQARGDADDESDWDLLILLNKEKISRSDFDTYAYPLIEYGWKNNEQVSPVLYTFNDWKLRQLTPFHENVEEEGIELCH